jgi:hypothetical protein
MYHFDTIYLNTYKRCWYYFIAFDQGFCNFSIANQLFGPRYHACTHDQVNLNEKRMYQPSPYWKHFLHDSSFIGSSMGSCIVALVGYELSMTASMTRFTVIEDSNDFYSFWAPRVISDKSFIGLQSFLTRGFFLLRLPM